MRFIPVFILFGLLAATAPATARTETTFRIPDSTKVQMITLTDGSTLVGKIVEVGDTEIKFEGAFGQSTIRKDRIRQIKEVDKSRIRSGKHWFPDPNRSRLFLWPTGRTLDKGQGYFGDIYLFLPSVAYGVTNNFSVEGGLSLFPGLNPSEQLMYLVPKLGFKLAPLVDASVAAIVFRVPTVFDNHNSVTVGLLCGTGTIGSEDYNLSVGLGYGFADGRLADKPAVMVGGELRIARRLALMSENWMSPGVDDALVSYGFRFLGERMAVDLALFNVLGAGAIFPGVPFVGFVWSF